LGFIYEIFARMRGGNLGGSFGFPGFPASPSSPEVG